MHPYDGYFFNPALGNGSGGAGYTVDKWLDDLEARYGTGHRRVSSSFLSCAGPIVIESSPNTRCSAWKGGIDKALVWPTYTQIGIDDRSQFDMIRTLPGGPAALCAIATQAKARGVHLLWPYHPWDHETKGQQWCAARKEFSPQFVAYGTSPHSRNNVTDPQRMAELQRDTCFDGFNGDTMGHIPRAFVDEAAKIYKVLPSPHPPYTLITRLSLRRSLLLLSRKAHRLRGTSITRQLVGPRDTTMTRSTWEHQCLRVDPQELTSPNGSPTDCT